MRMRPLAALFVAATLVTLGHATPARADDIRVLSSIAMRDALAELAPRFERQSGHRIVATFGLAGALKTRIEGGEAYDVAILTPALIDDLIRQGKATAASRLVIARTGLGLMIRAGAPPVDTTTVEAFKRTLLASRSLTYVPAGASGVAFVATATQLGIAAALAPKTKAATSGEEVNANVTSGAVEMAVLPVSEILPVKGAALGGVFPADVQTHIVMAGAASTAASQAARDFLALLGAPASDGVMTAKGLERVKP